MPDKAEKTEPPSSSRSSPLKKEVSFNPALTVPPSSASVPLKKRRSSIKQGAPMPIIPSKETYQHPDPLVRRLRLKDSWGKPVNLQSEFRDTRVVLFLFGSAARGASRRTSADADWPSLVDTALRGLGAAMTRSRSASFCFVGEGWGS